MRARCVSRSQAGRDTGLSLVEVMVALALFLVGSLSLLSVLLSTTNGSFDNRARVAAANLAAEDIDLARSLPYPAVQTTAAVPRTVGPRTYTVERQVTVTTGTTSATSACVASGGTRQLYKRVTTTVRTTFRGQVQPVRADTLIKAPTYQPADVNKGAIGFLVMDRNSKPLDGLTVTADGQSVSTDLSGCSFFDGLAPGDHVVTVTKPDAVTRASRTPLSKTVRVVASQITSDSLRIDTPVPVRLRVEVQPSSTAPNFTTVHVPTNLKAHLATPDRLTSTRLVAEFAPLVTTAPSVHTWTAFPAAAGYEAYLGRCSTPVHQTFAEPGTTPAQGTLTLTPVNVTLSGNGSEAQRSQSKTVTVKWRTPECAETLHYNAQTTSSCIHNSSGSDQCRLTLAVPPGDWTFTVATPVAGGPPTESGWFNHLVVQASPGTTQSVTIHT